MRKINWILLLIVILAFALRFWQLGQNPPSLTWDEVSWGYNAYSLGIDGRDEFGKFLPVQYLESFGDFKPPVYAYLDILPVKIIGLNEFAVRFPSAFLGVLTVLVSYFLVRRLFSKTENSDRYALITSFLLAISPWHINLSRAAFEANVATFFLVSGVWLFLCGIQDKRWYLPFSITSFTLSMYTFNTSRIVTPLLVLFLTLGFSRKLLKLKKQLLLAVVLGAILFLPLARFLTTPQSQLRFHEVNIFSDVGVVERINKEVANDQNVWWSKILHNHRLTFSTEFLKHYFDNLNPTFLFIKGDGNPKFSTQDVGELYLWELPFLIIGALFLFKKRQGFWWIIPLWLILGIVPAATARETPHALRIETVLPTFQILVAYGIVNSIYQIKKHQSLMRAALYAIIFLNFIYYFHGYLTNYPKEFSGEWQYGYKEAIAYAQSVQEEYDKVFFTENLGRPYIYFLFYTREDPVKFRREAHVWREALGFIHVDGYGKYQFAKELNVFNNTNEKFLFIDTPDKLPRDVSILKTFSLLNGSPILVAYIYIK